MRMKRSDLVMITILFFFAFLFLFFMIFRSSISETGSASKSTVFIDQNENNSAEDPKEITSFHLDLNQATWSEFTLLPGIGEKLAERIVEERSRLGGFANPDELTKIHGIGEKKLEKIRPFIIVSQPRNDDRPVQVQIQLDPDNNL